MKSNYKFGEVINLCEQISYDNDKPAFQGIFETGNGGVSLLGFKSGQKLDTHLAPAEVMVNVIEGEIEFTMIDKVHTLRGGEFLLIGAQTPHSVVARQDSKVMLVKLKN